MKEIAVVDLHRQISDMTPPRIRDFPEEGPPNVKEAIIWPFFPKNCMKLKQFGPPGGAPPLRSANVNGGAWPYPVAPLDPPMIDSRCRAPR